MRLSLTLLISRRAEESIDLVGLEQTEVKSLVWLVRLAARVAHWKGP